MDSLSLEDLKSLATWMTEELTGFYYMDKRYYYPQKHKINRPPLPYRKPIWLCEEERAIMSLFMYHVLREYWYTGKTTDFDWRIILEGITHSLGLRGYERNLDIRTLCRRFVQEFPKLANVIEREETRNVAV